MVNAHRMHGPVRFIHKLSACLVLALLLADIFLLSGTPPRPAWVSERLIFGAAFLGLVAPLLWLPIWARFNHKFDNARWIGRMETGIAYLTGMGISTFGWKKLLHLQFRTALSLADLPMTHQPGETLTWFYFGHSYVFGCIVGFIQVAGALLLFVPRTRLAGAILLFPVMLNILLINIFYQMNAGALLQSILLTLGLVYILASYGRMLVSALFRVGEWGSRKFIGAMIAGGLSFLFVRGLSQSLPRHSAIYGRYTVENLSINETPVTPTGGRDSVLTKIYFDLDNVCVLEYNSQQRRLIANYTIDPTQKGVPGWTIKSRFTDAAGKPLLLRARLETAGDGQLFLKGSLATDSISMILRRAVE